MTERWTEERWVGIPTSEGGRLGLGERTDIVKLLNAGAEKFVGYVASHAAEMREVFPRWEIGFSVKLLASGIRDQELPALLYCDLEGLYSFYREQGFKDSKKVKDLADVITAIKEVMGSRGLKGWAGH